MPRGQRLGSHKSSIVLRSCHSDSGHGAGAELFGVAQSRIRPLVAVADGRECATGLGASSQTKYPNSSERIIGTSVAGGEYVPPDDEAVTVTRGASSAHRIEILGNPQECERWLFTR